VYWFLCYQSSYTSRYFHSGYFFPSVKVAYIHMGSLWKNSDHVFSIFRRIFYINYTGAYELFYYGKIAVKGKQEYDVRIQGPVFPASGKNQPELSIIWRRIPASKFSHFSRIFGGNRWLSCWFLHQVTRTNLRNYRAGFEAKYTSEDCLYLVSHLFFKTYVRKWCEMTSIAVYNRNANLSSSKHWSNIKELRLYFSHHYSYLQR